MKPWVFISALMLLTLTNAVQGQLVEYKTFEDTVFKEGDLIRLPDLDFQLSGGNGVTKETLDSLNVVIDFLMTNPDLNVEIGCHMDSRDSDERNLRLSEIRSSWIVKYLISKGISEERLNAKGYGESQLIISNDEIDKQGTREDKEELHRVNRRIEMRILK